ncbi:MAG: hypothetical protein PVI99_08400 [Anaerolineales bacterium]
MPLYRLWGGKTNRLRGWDGFMPLAIGNQPPPGCITADLPLSKYSLGNRSAAAASGQQNLHGTTPLPQQAEHQ